MKHYTIPVFIPMHACPFRCIFCDQEKISGHCGMPAPEEIKTLINNHLDTIPKHDTFIEVGFFGGTFTGLPLQQQIGLLNIAEQYLFDGKIHSIRLSTRPDFIDENIVTTLKEHHVTTIELGAQSMDDDVLRRSKRGHNVNDIILAAGIIVQNGIRLGLQMMIGLPGDSPEKDIHTAYRFIGLGAADVRIYPVLVIRGTVLEKMYLEGRYTPLTLNEAVSGTASVYRLFRDAGVNVIRTGLHPSEGLLSGQELIAGPFHVSFRELVLTELWKQKFLGINIPATCRRLVVHVPAKEINYAVGYGSSNRKLLKEKYADVVFISDPSLKPGDFYVDFC